MNRSQTAISLFILFCMTMQAWAYFLPRQRQFYPFVDYPMYRRAYGPPVEADWSDMYARLEDGSEVAVTYEYMGLKLFAWKDGHVGRITVEPTDDPRFKELVEQHRLEAFQNVVNSVESREHKRVVALRFETTAWRIEDSEIVKTRSEQVVPIPPEVTHSTEAAP